MQHVLLQEIGGFETYEWQDGSTTSTYTINHPGRYLLTYRPDNCVLKDFIFKEGIEYDCACQFYVPHVLSPYLDGRNDAFLPVAPCELVYYGLRIFGRWRQPVYQSNDQAVGWNAMTDFDYFPAGEYICLLRYQFTYQDEIEHQSGRFLLICSSNA